MKRRPSLLLCIVMDLIGMATYSVPVVGEVADFIWAPVSAVVFFLSFGGWKGAMGGVGNLIEELLPGTDIIPSFTIMWFMQRMNDKPTASKARLSG